ncbi:hypothetical protein DC74_2928 [Streptomyces noursei]|nr:hypothetical protein DC74_2928 [Streptomyces noursei]
MTELVLASLSLFALAAFVALGIEDNRCHRAKRR